MYAIRLRFRTAKGLTSDAKVLQFNVREHAVTLQSSDDLPLPQGGWLSLKSAGFENEEDAQTFGRQINYALMLASVRNVWGVDTGEGRPTSALFPGGAALFGLEGNIRSNVHGLDVYEDLPDTKWFALSAKGHVSADPNPITRDIERFAPLLAPVSAADEPVVYTALRLINEALINPDVSARLVLAIASVEMLSQGERWSESQIASLSRLVELAEQEESLSAIEREEVIDAVSRAYRMSVRQGMRRLFRRLDLEDMWKNWDKLYGERSSILHGLSYKAPSERSALVMPALMMASKVVLHALEPSIPGAAADLNETIQRPPSL